MQGGQSCSCFLPGSSCIALQLHLYLVSSSPARWGNSVLNSALCPMKSALDPPPDLLCELGLPPHPCSQPLHLSWPLLSSSSSSGRLACYPTLALSLCCFTCVHSLRVQYWECGSLPHSHPLGQVQCSPPPLLFVLDYNSLFMLFNFVGGNVRSAQGLCWIMFPGGRREGSAWYSPVPSADSHKQLWNWLVGRNVVV
jgi:hypothetical protein